AVEVGVELLDVVDGDGLDFGDVFIRSKYVVRVALGIRRDVAPEFSNGDGLRIAALFSMPASVSCLGWSNSLAGRRGWRRTSATRVRTAGKFSRVVSMVAMAEVASPPTPTLALSRSNSSLSCWRVCLAVPRISISPARSPAVMRFIRLRSS